MMRSVLSIIVGFVLWTVIWLGGNQGVKMAMPDAFAEDGSSSQPTVLLGILVLSVGCSFVAGCVAARMAKSNPRKHGVVLGVMLLAVGIMVQMQFWTVMPLWYHIAFLVLLVPVTLVGATACGGATRMGSEA